MANLPFDNANFNLINFANIYPDIMDSTPKTIEYQYKDANGNIQTKSIANRGMFKQQLWDDVDGALGQFNRTFYVDAENGDDNNNGSISSPFKTIKKAIDSVPTGGEGDIYLTNNATHFIKENIYIDNKHIRIYEKTYGDKYNIEFIVSDNGSYRLLPGIKNRWANGYISFHGGNTIKITDNTGSTNDFYLYQNAMFGNTAASDKFNISVVFVGGIIENLIGQCYTIYTRYNGTLNVVANSTTFKNLSNAASKLIKFEPSTLLNLNYANCLLKDENDSSLNLSDYISGIIKDANGVPRNIVSNIVF